MATNSSVNLRITNNADGFEIGGGTTPRKITLSGGDVSMVGGGSATITLPTSSCALYGTGQTDVALADGGTGASLTDPNADRIMFWDDSLGAVTWLTMGTGLAITGTTLDASAALSKSVYDYICYESGGTFYAYKTSDGSTISSNADASVVIQAAIDQCDATTGSGGRIYLQPGTYTLSTVLTIQGNQTTDSKMVSLHGAGQQVTILKPSVNVNAIAVTNRAKVSIRDMAIIVRGSGSGLTSTNSSVGQRAFWQSEFKNIYIYDDSTSTAHSGWGINFGNPFRSVIENIEMNQVKNGMKLEALDTSTGYNPGDLTVNRMFIELQSGATSGVGIHLSSTSTGDMNQMTFNMVELIGTGTGQTAILLDGTSGSNNHTNWTGINVEEFDVILDIVKGRNNYFDFNYVITRDAASTTYFRTNNATGAYGNRISCKYMDTYAQAVTVINDGNNLTDQRNKFTDIVMQGSATSLTFTRTDATYLHRITDNIDGTWGFDEGASGSVSANAVEVNSSFGTFTDTTDIPADNTRNIITLTNRGIRSTSNVRCYMMSAPDSGAMLVASCVPSDGSCAIYIRNVGSSSQTSTYTMGFTVEQ